MAPLALPHYQVLPYSLCHLVLSQYLISSSARVTPIKSQQHHSVKYGQTSESIDRTPGIPGSDKNIIEVEVEYLDAQLTITDKT